jgi:gliding motility-associated-like protein
MARASRTIFGCNRLFMKKLLLFYGWLLASRCAAQCPYPVTLTSGGGSCIGAMLKVSSSHPQSVIAWYKDGVQVAVDSAAITWNTQGTVVAGGNGPGTAPNQVEEPWAVFVDDEGNVYVASEDRVTRWAPGATSGVVVAGSNGIGSNTNQVSIATGVYVDKEGNVYVLESGNGRVTRWGPGAAIGVTVAGGHGQGAGADQLYYPEGFYVDCGGNLYISDQYNCRVQLWAPGASTGVTVAGGNGSGLAANQLFDPFGVFVDSAKNIYVSEVYAGRVIKWASGATEGTVVAGAVRDTDTISLGEGLYGGADGALYITDWGDNTDHGRVLRLAPGAAAGIPIAGYGVGPGAELLSHPDGPFVDHYGNLYVIDVDQSRVLEFKVQSTIENGYTAASPGNYYAVVTDMNGAMVTSNTLSIHLPPVVPPSISITATATNIDICTPVTFAAMVMNAGANPTYQWQVSGVTVGADSPVYSNNIFANGDDVSCILHSDSSCNAGDTSNVITLNVDPQVYTTVTITDSPSIICQGVTEIFAATVINGSNAPVFQWLVNGIATSESGNAYRSDTLTSGDVVYCLITSDASCGLAKSNSIPVTVYPAPSVAAGQVFNVPYGQSLQLEPVVSGDIVSYDWSPSAGLSDSIVANPVADPPYATDYELQVTAAGGCTAKGSITVNVYTPLALPNAFSPNGDGRNDIFYVLGGPEGSVIKGFNIYDRWGQEVFRVHDGAPGDPAFGWDGRYGGKPAPVGVYVYEVVMSYPGSRMQRYQGTVVLVR